MSTSVAKKSKNEKNLSWPLASYGNNEILKCVWLYIVLLVLFCQTRKHFSRMHYSHLLTVVGVSTGGVWGCPGVCVCVQVGRGVRGECVWGVTRGLYTPTLRTE